MRIEIPPFPQGKRIALTLSFDDGRIYDRQLVKAFNEWGLKATFNLNSGMLSRTGKKTPEESRGHLDVSEVEELFRGHEVAIHTVTHPHLPKLDASQIAEEVLADRRALEDIVGYPVRGMAYPFGTYNQQVIDILKSLGIVYSRTVENSDNCFPAKEPLAWQTTCHQFAGNPTVPERFETLYANSRYSGVFFPWGHSYEFPDRKDWPALERIFKPISGKPDVWYCTNIELFDYETARKRIVVAANRKTAYNPSAISVTLQVDGKLIEVPPGKVVQLV